MVKVTRTSVSKANTHSSSTWVGSGESSSDIKEMYADGSIVTAPFDKSISDERSHELVIRIPNGAIVIKKISPEKYELRSSSVTTFNLSNGVLVADCAQLPVQ